MQSMVQKRPADFDKGVEYNAWLEYEWDTVLEFCLMMLEEESYTGKDISDNIPFIESCVQFFYEHYQYYEAKKRKQSHWMKTVNWFFIRAVVQKLLRWLKFNSYNCSIENNYDRLLPYRFKYLNIR